jgi:hypothetical protein
MMSVLSLERAGSRVGERRRFAEAVAAARRLPCGARSREAAAELALRPAAFGAQTVLADPAARGNLTSPALLGASEARRHSPTRAPAGSISLFSSQTTTRCSKSGADGCVGAYAALTQRARTQNSPCGLFCAWRAPLRLKAQGHAAQRGQSVVLDGPARRIYAVPRSAAMRSHRSRPAKREAQGTDAEGGGAASKPERPSAPALPLHRRRAARQRT